MKKTVVGLSVFLSLVFSFLIGFLPRAFAQDVTSSTIEPKVNRGDVMVGGSLGFSYSTYSKLTFELNPTVEYFVADRLSLGGTVGLMFSESYNSYLVGPSATYYFWKEDRLTANVGAEIRFGYFEYDNGAGRVTENATTGRFRIGLNYFLTPEVSLGPVFTLDKAFGSGQSSTAIDNSTLKVQFQIHL